MECHQSTRRLGDIRECPLVVFAGVREWPRLTFGECSDIAILRICLGTCFAIGEPTKPQLV